MTTITFVRHGQTDDNVAGRAQGHRNNPLNETGRRQAAAVAARLAAGQTWDLFLSSDLLRARETAMQIAEAIGVSVTSFDVRLREIDRGLIAGTTEQERLERWGERWRDLELGEESLLAVRERGVGFVSEIAKQHPERRILIVSHGIWIGQTLKGLMQDETIGDGMSNGSVTIIVKNGERWELECYNCTMHDCV